MSVANRPVTLLNRYKSLFLFIIILAIGIFARVWEFGSLPPGLNVDEASIGVEAYYIYKFGMDRNGVSYPIHLISWGSGQNALYAYLLIPFVALGGINAVSVRLPMMLSGILSLPLMYIAGKRLLSEKLSLTAMFFMAISPWHIVNSRWAVESNILPFFFLAGFTALLLSNRRNHWFIISSILFALCLYSYGIAYLGVPIFLLLAIPASVYAKRLSVKQAIIGLIVFFLIALPIALFIAVNTLQWDTIHLGLITIPRLPVQPRYEIMAAIFGGSPLHTISENAAIMLKLLWTQADSFPWNHVEPFGYFYKFTFPLTIAGLFLILPLKFNRDFKTEHWLLASWVIASICIGFMQPVNLTRINLIFTPILLLIAIFLIKLDERIPYALIAMLLVFTIGFVFFTKAYHGEEYQRRSSSVFNAGLIPAIEYATEKSDSPICFTEQTYSTYIYVLLTQKMRPSEYIDRIEWLYPSDPADPARTPRTLGRYRFRISDCLNNPDAIYILTLRETPPNPDIEYKERKFNKYQVLIPK